MIAFGTSVRIARPIEDVFALVADLLDELAPLRAEGDGGQAEVIDLEAKER